MLYNRRAANGCKNIVTKSDRNEIQKANIPPMAGFSKNVSIISVNFASRFQQSKLQR